MVGNIMTHVESTEPKRVGGYVNFQVGMASKDMLLMVGWFIQVMKHYR